MKKNSDFTVLVGTIAYTSSCQTILMNIEQSATDPSLIDHIIYPFAMRTVRLTF